MGFSRQEYWTGLPCPSPGDLPDPGIEHGSPTLQADSLSLATSEADAHCLPHTTPSYFLPDLFKIQELFPNCISEKSKDLHLVLLTLWVNDSQSFLDELCVLYLRGFLPNTQAHPAGEPSP